MYQPLSTSRREIRLLQIVQGSEDGPIECSLHTVDFDDIDFEFAALSYVWGDESITKNVLVDGHQRAVTTNLESALRNFWRYFAKNGVNTIRRANLVSSMMDQPGGLAGLRRYLGSENCDLHHESDAEDGGDAEDDEDAKDEGDPESGRGTDGEEDTDGEQDSEESGLEYDNDPNGTSIKDGLMVERILCSHRRARVGGGNLPIWIDAVCINQADPAEKSKQIPMMRDIYAKAACVFSWLGPPDHRNVDLALSTIRKLAVHLHSDGYSRAELNRDHPELCKIHYNHVPFNRYWEAISNFANAEYFERLWIFQELWATDDAIFLCGDEYLPMRSLTRYHAWAVSLAQGGVDPPSPPLTIPIFAPITQVYEMKAGLKHAPVGTRLFLNIVRQWRCKNPRDKVFALFGIFRMDLTPDYTMPVAEVYASWATNPCQDLPLGSLLFYSGIGLYPRPPNNHGLASWQPNFEVVGEQVKSFDASYAYQYLDIEVPARFQPTVSQTRGLTCFGARVTKLSRVVAEAPKPTLDTSARVGDLESKHLRLPTRQSMLPVLKYLVDHRRRLWAPAYHHKGSPLWGFVETVNESVGGGSPATSDLTPDILRGFSARRLIKAAQSQIASTMDGPDDFTKEELQFMGVQSLGELNDCLGDVPWSSDKGVPRTPELKARQKDAVSQFVSRLWIFAFTKSLFHTEDGRLGAGPPGMEAGDCVYLVHGCSWPVLVRGPEGGRRHVGVSYIPGLSGAQSFQVLKDRAKEVQPVHLA
ncbi:heterokaryon incompatibility protein-domain-containing protein [Chaetomium fimeti]|uniref:Heterokaryon incompatibility protein-domain-containing protein n=1 Tax=Chaetomium fimeti TaxID=1854472 RepID=A0AAE0HQC4_9PEZI|nr:heterokaryon incompatibility protein-domain-containing protein [Chaetomium fimeti]